MEILPKHGPAQVRAAAALLCWFIPSPTVGSKGNLLVECWVPGFAPIPWPASGASLGSVDSCGCLCQLPLKCWYGLELCVHILCCLFVPFTWQGACQTHRNLINCVWSSFQENNCSWRWLCWDQACWRKFGAIKIFSQLLRDVWHRARGMTSCRRGVFWCSQVCLKFRFLEPKSFSLFTFEGRMMWDLLIGTVLFGPFPLLSMWLKAQK